MGKTTTIARRTFLIGSAAIVGGVAFGVYAARQPHTNPLLATLQPGEAALTPYVLIRSDGVTIITPRADIGQGAYSVQAALVAEELDIPLDAVNVDPGPPSPAYYNAAVMSEQLPIAATSDTTFAKGARTMAGAAGKLLGLQITGGSSTVADAYDKMRHAGAVARETLLTAAARKTGISRNRLQTKDGAVLLPDGSKLAYTALAKEAAEVDLPDRVALKKPEDWRLLGKPMTRIDTKAKSNGTARFGIDLTFPDMLVATVKTAPVPGGRLRTLDAAKAEALAGVVKVVRLPDGAGVIAKATWAAFKGVRALDLTWREPDEDLPPPRSTQDVFARLDAAFTPDHQDSCFKDEGDVEQALATGQALTAQYRVPLLAHAPLEPMNATVRLAEDGRHLDVWTGTQVPIFVRDKAAEIAGIAPDNVRVHVQVSGGSFGRRLEDDYVQHAVRLAMAMPGRHIKTVWTREQDMTHDVPRPAGRARVRGRVNTTTQQVETLDLALAYPSVGASIGARWGLPVVGPDVSIVAGAWDQPYRIPNYRVTGYRAPVGLPVSSWRSVGASGNGFIHECALDELIAAAGADPLRERIRLCWHAPSRRVLETVGEMSRWDEPVGSGRGRGVAFTLSFGVPTAEVVEVSETADGIRIDKVFVAVEVGRVIDPVNFENQVQGGALFGLGHAMFAELSLRDGAYVERNYDSYRSLRINEAPDVVVKALQTTDDIKGIGEPPVPPAAPALANAIFAATGQRIRELPLARHVRFAA